MILISPWARKTTDGEPSPKNYPHWNAVVQSLSALGLEVHQVSQAGEPAVAGCRLRWDDLPLRVLESKIRECKGWISVDNFFHHLAWHVGKPGVVLFGSSDPLIFGHPENLNLLKDRRFLRGRQFGLWSQEPPRPEAFVPAVEVVSAVQALLSGSGR